MRLFYLLAFLCLPAFGMQQYQDIATDTTGNPHGGVLVTVTDHFTGATAALFSAQKGTSIANPLTSNVDGSFSFYAPNGAYDIAVAGGKTVVNKVLFDPTDTSPAQNGAFPCEIYGVNPNASAAANTTALQSCLTRGGSLTLLTAGTVAVNPPIYLSSNTDFRMGNGTILQQAAGNSTNIFRNLNWQNNPVTCSNGITSAASSGPSITGYYLSTADCGSNAHGLLPGNYVLIRGDTTRTYLGVWQVLSVPTATTFTFYYSAVSGTAPGASSGTITTNLADANISISGGTIDYNGANNQANFDYHAMAIVVNNIGNFQLKNTVLINCTKWCVYTASSENAHLENVGFSTQSDGWHLIGTNWNASANNVYGQTGDDFISWNASLEGFTTQDLPITAVPGELIGLDLRNLNIRRGAADAVALYPSGSNEMRGVVIDGVHLIDGINHVLYVTLPVTGGLAAAATAVKDITLKNVGGAPVIDNIVKIGGSTASGGTHPAVTVGHLLIDNMSPGQPIAPGGTVGAGAAINVVDASIPSLNIINSYIDFDSTSFQRQLLTYDANSTISTLRIKNNRFENSVGGSGVVLVNGNASGTLTTALIEGNSFPNFMTYGGTTGAYVEMSGNRFTTYSAVRANYSASFNIHDNVWTTPGATPPILLYGSGLTISLKEANNDYGNATNWLQIGTAGGDTLTVNGWLKGHLATTGTDPGISWTSSSYTFNLKGSDSSYFVDVAKFNGTIFPGALAYNSNSATGPGIGPVVYQGGAWQRISTVVARVTPLQTFSGATTGNTLTNITNMSFAVAANEEWTAEYILDIGAALATTGVKFAVTTPAGATVELNAHVGADVVVLAGAYDKRTALSATALDFTTTLLASAGDALAHIFLWVLNGANAGNVTLQMAQSTSAATAVVARSGSAMRANRVN